TALGERGRRLVDARRTDIVELGGNHDAPPESARQTRSGLHGIATSVTPRGRSASTTALTTAGVDAIVPASPTPLTPTRFGGAGVSVRSVVNLGRSAALGT